MTVKVPPDGPVRLGSVRLPAGKQISGRQANPLLWATVSSVPGAGHAWLACHGLQSGTGLVPILLAYLDGAEAGGRPWDSGEVGDRCNLAEVDRLDPATILAASWADSLDPDDDDPEQAAMVAPFSLRFPGLAKAQEEGLSPAEITQIVGGLPSARLGLVPANRPADVLALVGYNGTINRYGTPAGLSAVMRSWEDRFGAVLLEVGFSHIRLLVQRPPRSLAAARAAAAEIWAMCDEFWPIEHPGESVRDVSEIADYVVGGSIWSLWLD
jgi:hypothetical protein